MIGCLHHAIDVTAPFLGEFGGVLLFKNAGEAVDVAQRGA